jgi:hypothetical protein
MMPPAKKLQNLRWLVARVLLRLGVPLRLNSPDRVVLEQQILPYFAASADFRRVLFVGCDWYTQSYERLFRGKDYVTIEIDATRRPFGAKRHIVGSLADLGSHFTPRALDLIVCNGVFGWGLDAKDDCAKAFAECAAALRVGGVLVLGWDDVPEHRPFDPMPLLERAGFRPSVFPPLGAARHTVERHVYDFLTA